MRKLISTILALCMVLVLLPVTAAADDAGLPVNKWDVSSDKTYYSELVYKVDKDAIEIYAKGANQVYELTGTTNRPIRLWGGNRERVNPERFICASITRKSMAGLWL